MIRYGSAEDRWLLVHGDALEALKLLPDASVDALVTDPPAGIEFMGKAWDSFTAREANASGPQTEAWDASGGADGTRPFARNATPRFSGKLQRKAGDDRAASKALQIRANFVAFIEAIFKEALRVLKPGGYALVWSIPKTSHWTTWAVENAGFEVVDTVAHLFGSGFPKSMDISKAIDKAAGAEREVVEVVDTRGTFDGRERPSSAINTNWREAEGRSDEIDLSKKVVTAPATDAAKRWDGWGTALKPAREDWILARRPLDGTYAANVLKHGVGGLNIDATRIATAESLNGGAYSGGERPDSLAGHIGEAGGKGSMLEAGGGRLQPDQFKQPAGRWPPNVALSHSPGCVRTGTRKVRSGVSGTGGGFADKYAGEPGKSRPMKEGWGSFNGPDGTEEIPDFACEPGCPVALLDAQSGQLTSGTGAVKRATAAGSDESIAIGAESRPAGTPMVEYGDTGGASRYFPVFHVTPQDTYWNTAASLSDLLCEACSASLAAWLTSVGASGAESSSDPASSRPSSALMPARDSSTRAPQGSMDPASRPASSVKSSGTPTVDGDSALTPATQPPSELTVRSASTAGSPCARCGTATAPSPARNAHGQSVGSPPSLPSPGARSGSTPTPSPASVVGSRGRNGITPTTPSPTRSSGFVGPATAASTASPAELGTSTCAFYCPKAPNRQKWRVIRCADREGCQHIGDAIRLAEGRKLYGRRFENLPPCPKCGGKQVAEAHPTPKNVDLMRWLARLITPPGGAILDPFFGTGSTGEAALLEGFRIIGIEREESYVKIAAARMRAAGAAAPEGTDNEDEDEDEDSAADAG